MLEDLIEYIISEKYGINYQKICNLIIKNKGLSLLELLRRTGFTFVEVKEILIVLIKSNFIYFESISCKFDPNLSEMNDLIYKINIIEILNSIR